VRRRTLDGLRALNEMNHKLVGDPETHTRIQQYELAFRMQSSVPDLTNVKAEPESTYALYGDEARKPGTFRPHRPACPAHGRARRALRAESTTITGTPTPTSPAGCPASARTLTSPAGA
jgi:hypothetical protein